MHGHQLPRKRGRTVTVIVAVQLLGKAIPRPVQTNPRVGPR